MFCYTCLCFSHTPPSVISHPSCTPPPFVMSNTPSPNIPLTKFTLSRDTSHMSNSSNSSSPYSNSSTNLETPSPKTSTTPNAIKLTTTSPTEHTIATYNMSSLIEYISSHQFPESSYSKTQEKTFKNIITET